MEFDLTDPFVVVDMAMIPGFIIAIVCSAVLFITGHTEIFITPLAAYIIVVYFLIMVASLGE